MTTIQSGNFANNNHQNSNCSTGIPEDKVGSGIRVRFAPSPTGLLHVGSFRTALFNWLFARKNHGTFILRIEDTDRKRSSDEFLESQMADMKWMGLDWDEGPQKGGEFGPYFQMERLETYRKFADKLLAEDKAYYCYCSPEELQEERDKAKQEGKDPGYWGKCGDLTPEEKTRLEAEGRKPCIRFRVPREGSTPVKDIIKGDVSFENRLIDDFVIMKSDGIPTYNYAAVIDDHLMKISHIIRGDEHLSNTPKQALIYLALGLEPPVFVHIPIILNVDKTKLSKRKGAVHLLDFKNRGYMKEAMLNFVALLGWAPKDDREILSREELLEAFSLEGITKHPAVFDENKLAWINGQYIGSLPVDLIIERLMPFVEMEGIDPSLKNPEWWKTAVSLYSNRMKTLGEFAQNLAPYFRDVEEYDPKGVKKHFKHQFLVEALPQLALRLNKDPDFTVESIEKTVRDYAEELDISAAKLIHAVRLALLGNTASPSIFDVMALAGKELLTERLNRAASYIKENINPE